MSENGAHVAEIGGTTPTNPAGVPIEGASVPATPTTRGKKAAPAAAAVEVQHIKGDNADDQLSGEKVTVVFFQQEGDMGKLPVEVGHNGNVYRMPRGVPCTIPVEVLGVVKDAQEIVYEANGANVVARTKPRFSYEIRPNPKE